MSGLSLSVKVVVIALCTGLLLTADAWAAGVGFNVKTSLSINAPSQEHPGKIFHITGWLTSTKTHCRAHNTVKLIKHGHGVIETDETTQRGKYSFYISINHSRKFHTRFAGSVDGSFPVSRICRASESETIIVETS